MHDRGRRSQARSAAAVLLAAIAGAHCAHAQQGEEQPWAPQNGVVEMSDGNIVELHVVDLPLSTVLRMLSVKGRRNIIASPAVQGTVTADLYSVTFEQALKAILTANNADYVIRDGFIHVYTKEELIALRTGDTPVMARVFRLNYIAAADVEAVITPLLSEDGVIAKSPAPAPGLEVDLGKTGGNSLAVFDFVVVYDYPERLTRVARIIKMIDVRPQQVLIEATILRVRLTEDNALGIDFSLVAGIDLELLGATSRGVQDLTLGLLPQDRFERFNANATTDFAGNVPDGGLTLGIIKDHVAVFIRALEQISDTSVLANPKILALNKQVGNVIVGRRDGYITTTVTETQAIQKVEFLETGTQLTFRPFIGTDGYVRMELHPEDSVGGLTAEQLPFEQTTEVTTNIIVKDGHTILIGGLFREVTSDARSQLPVLGDLPGVGDLFRSRSDSLDREEVIILLTVHIVGDDDVYAADSDGRMQDIERARVSFRRGMMWHGRERLAQRYYRDAVDEFTAGMTDRALSKVRLALHNYPRFMDALELKERILSQRDWEDDGALGRDFISKLIMNKRGMHQPMFGRPPIEPPPPEPDHDGGDDKEEP